MKRNIKKSIKKRDIILLCVFILLALLCMIPLLSSHLFSGSSGNSGDSDNLAVSVTPADLTLTAGSADLNVSDTSISKSSVGMGNSDNPDTRDGGKEAGTQTKVGAGLLLVVKGVEGEILRVPLWEDANYLIRDGSAEKVEDDFSLSDLGKEDELKDIELNLIEVKEGIVSVLEANCKNQICVNSVPLRYDSYDIPIVCLPHTLALYIEEMR